LCHLPFSRAPATSVLYTLSLHDALPISVRPGRLLAKPLAARVNAVLIDCMFSSMALKARPVRTFLAATDEQAGCEGAPVSKNGRSEEHTSELQSRENLVCRLLLEKKKEE